MKARTGVAALACAMVGALAFSSGAAAKPGYFIWPEHFSMSADLPKSNGYRVDLRSTGHRTVEVYVYGHGETAIYLAKGKANRHGIDVDFGRFGQIHARFTGHPVKKKENSGCRGRRPIEMQGRLEGNLRFRGEDGYVEVSSKRVKASFEHNFREVCEDGGSSHPRRDIVNVLYAAGKTESHQIRFSALYQQRLFGPPAISASILERIGRVLAFKSSSSFDEESRLEFSPPQGRPQMVTVEPTSPFSGSASYVAKPDGSSEWSGDLQVSFAGLGMLPLTGTGFHAVACRPRLPKFFLDCRDQEDSPR